MRAGPTILHLDLDAFFASVEQRDKPSLRGRPVIVGGVGFRGVVSTASYEARRFGVRSAMSTREARGRCPHAAYLSGRFGAYQQASRIVMDLLRAHAPLVEPLSLDEAFVDVAPLGLETVAEVRDFAATLRAEVRSATGGLTASVGAGTSKFIAKVASDLEKPDGLVVVPPGTETELLDPMPVTVIPGVGPATRERLRRAGVHTVAELAALSLDELVRQVGRAHGTSLHALARAHDERAVQPAREAKSVSVEDTYETDLTDRTLMAGLLARQAAGVAERLHRHGLSGRTVTLKVRLHDFTTLSRSQTLAAPTDHAPTIARTARGLLEGLDTSDGVRLLGVGVSGLADWIQEDLFGDLDADADPAPRPGDPNADPDADPPGDRPTGTGSSEAAPDGGGPATAGSRPPPGPRRWAPGQDVVHEEHGPGWVWGSGRGVVTVRFETAQSPPGPVRSFRIEDPALSPAPAPTAEVEPDSAPEGGGTGP